MITKDVSAKEVRLELDEFTERHYEPNLKVVAEEIGMAYSYLMDFKNGHKVPGPNTLDKMYQFFISN